jgi:hypothetical protein
MGGGLHMHPNSFTPARSAIQPEALIPNPKTLQRSSGVSGLCTRPNPFTQVRSAFQPFLLFLVGLDVSGRCARPDNFAHCVQANPEQWATHHDAGRGS